jgi:hypothetical protein
MRAHPAVVTTRRPVVRPAVEPSPRREQVAAPPVVARNATPPAVDASSPPAVTVVPPAAETPPTRAAHARSGSGTQAARATPRTGAPDGVTNSTRGMATPVAERRLVLIRNHGSQGMLIEVDGRQGDYVLGQPFWLPVGRHRFALVPTDASCNGAVWSAEVEPGTDVLEFRQRVFCPR